MANLFGKKISKRDLYARTGNISQFADIRESIISEGNGTGVKLVDIRTGSGLNLSVLPGKGMDIASCDFKGIPLSWMAPAGITNPGYYEEQEDRWVRSFTGGLLTTCGMTYCGAPCEDEGTALGLHGRVSNYTAEAVCIEKTWNNDQYEMSVKGQIRQAALCNENLVLTRKITTIMGESKIRITDSIENLGFERQPLMMLYHFTFGWPMVSEKSRIKANIDKTTARPGQVEAEKELNLFNTFPAPQDGYAERCYYHNLAGDNNGNTGLMLINDELELAISMKYNLKQLFNLVEWKQMRSGIYVLGLEPSNCYLEGRDKAKADGTLQYIEPGEVKNFDVELEIIEGKENIEKY